MAALCFCLFSDSCRIKLNGLPIYVYEHFREVNSLNLHSISCPHSFRQLGRVNQGQVRVVLLSVCRSGPVRFLDRDLPQPQLQPVGTAGSSLINRTEPHATSAIGSVLVHQPAATGLSIIILYKLCRLLSTKYMLIRLSSSESVMCCRTSNELVQKKLCVASSFL